MGSQGRLNQVKYGGICAVFLSMCLCITASPVMADLLPYGDIKPIERDQKTSRGLGARGAQSQNPQNDGETSITDSFFSNDAPAIGVQPEMDVLDEVMGLSQQTDWLGDTTDVDDQGNITVLEIVQSYVNIVNVPGARSLGNGQASNSAQGNSGGRGGSSIALSLADGLDASLALSLTSDILRPEKEGDLITFSLFGIGHFLIVGDEQSGNISMINLSSGSITGLHTRGDYAPRPPGATTKANGQAMAQSASPRRMDTTQPTNIITWTIDLIASPLVVATSLCILGVWLFWKIARRFS